MQSNTGTVSVDLKDTAYDTFTDMSFFEKFLPEGTILVDVTIAFDANDYDQMRTAFFLIKWKRPE